MTLFMTTGTLKMLAMRSLAHLMLHEPTSLLALRGGMMKRLMRNALSETRLPSYVDLRRLEYRCRVLHKRVLEIDPGGMNGAVWKTLEEKKGGEGGVESIAAAEERVRKENREEEGRRLVEMMVGWFDYDLTLPMMMTALKKSGDDPGM